MAGDQASTVDAELVPAGEYLGPDGKFKSGNPGGGGTSIKSVQSWRKALYAAITPADILAITQKLVKLARKGVPWAMTEVLDRCLGKATVSINVGADGDTGREYDARAAVDARRITAILLMSSLPEVAPAQAPRLLTAPEPQGGQDAIAMAAVDAERRIQTAQGVVGGFESGVKEKTAQSGNKIGAAADSGSGENSNSLLNVGRKEREQAVLSLESHVKSDEPGTARASAAEVLAAEQATPPAPVVIKRRRQQYHAHAKHVCCWPGCVKAVVKRGAGCNWHSRSVAEADRLRRVARAGVDAGRPPPCPPGPGGGEDV
jgi:hypothetical protein